MGTAITNTHPLEVTGLFELAQDMPDDAVYELRIRFRKTEDGAEIFPQRDIFKVDLRDTTGE